MRYIVSGADRRSGRDVVVAVEADDEHAATAAANRRGILVAGCEPTDRTSAGAAVVSSTAVPRGGPRGMAGSRPRRRRVILLAVAAVLVAASACVVLHGRRSAAAPRASSQFVPLTSPPPTSSDADSPRLALLKSVGRPVWERQGRREWLAAHGDARLVAQQSATGFTEYAAGDTVAKTHAVFLDDRIAVYELLVLRGDLGAADRVVRGFEDALGPAELASPHSGVSDAERDGMVRFREWRLSEGDRRVVVRCSVRRGEAVDGTPIYYVQQTFADGASVDAAGAAATARQRPFDGRREGREGAAARPRDPGVPDALLADLAGTDPKARQGAIGRVRRMRLAGAPGADRVAAALGGAVHDADPVVALDAAAALVDLGEVGIRTLGDELAGDPDDRITPAVVGCLARGGAAAVPTLVGLLGHEQRSKAVAASSALAEVGTPAIPALREATRTVGPSTAAQTRACALLALAQIGPAARAALPDIRDRLQDRNPAVRQVAEEAMRAVRDGR